MSRFEIPLTDAQVRELIPFGERNHLVKNFNNRKARKDCDPVTDQTLVYTGIAHCHLKQLLWASCNTPAAEIREKIAAIEAITIPECVGWGVSLSHEIIGDLPPSSYRVDNGKVPGSALYALDRTQVGRLVTARLNRLRGDVGRAVYREQEQERRKADQARLDAEQAQAKRAFMPTEMAKLRRLGPKAAQQLGALVDKVRAVEGLSDADRDSLLADFAGVQTAADTYNKLRREILREAAGDLGYRLAPGFMR